MSHENLDFESVEHLSDSVYEACIVIAKRARQINQKLADELRDRLGDIETEEDLNEDSIDRESLISELEKQEKPTTKAMTEMVTGKLTYEYVESKKSQAEK